ncbi:hypothetical protein BDN67DRAFT_1012398 [Paxillus ammoniavirescens]|nr:hypothetical protein BDN67DRAFT_1012398 [Paxillus ammoniavirescens]
MNDLNRCPDYIDPQWSMAPSVSRNRFHPTTSWWRQVPAMDPLQVLFTANIFDYVYKLEDEVAFIWSRNDWGIGKVLFVPTRYIPFVIIPLTLFSSFAANSDVHTCGTLLYIIVVLEIVAITLSEVTFGLRAYAMWNRNRAILVIYCCVAMAYVAALFILCSREYPLGANSGCYKTGGSSIIFAAFVVVMLTEAVTVFLTLYRAYRYFRHTPNALVQNMTRDGIFYCMSMFSLSVANVLLTFLVPLQDADMIAIYQSVMHAMLATRMQLHLREVDQHAYLVDRFAEESLAPVSFARSAFLADI